MRLANKRIVVVGAGSVGGVSEELPSNGRAAATLFAREGAEVLAVDRSGEAAEATCAALRSEGLEATPLEADVTTDADRIVEAARNMWGGLDVVHYNVGISRKGGLFDEGESDWRAVFAANLDAAWALTRAAAPAMGRGGAFLYVSSVAAIRGGAYAYTSYEVSKAALGRLARSVAVELAPRGIRANTILPGLIDTPHAAHFVAGGRDLDAFRAGRAALVPLARQGTAWDVAEAAAFLASDAAGYITGVELPVDGALSLVGPGYGAKPPA